jgi:hypothetical protein
MYNLTEHILGGEFKDQVGLFVISSQEFIYSSHIDGHYCT